ncbi:MAG TPA: DUF3352 domain-containing protein [Solirubrobacterales bacterium]|nr:DUF3352 domain-containing protein [Solirubrobacterales bacterium]
MKLRLVLLALVATLVALVAAGCGGGDDDGGAGADPASVAPAGTPLYLDFVVRPKGETKTNIEDLAQKIAGVDDLGGLIVEELEESATDEGEEVDFEKEIEPWLGERGAYVFPKFEEGDFETFAVVVEATDSGAAEEFLETQAEQADEEVTDESFEGVDFKVDEDGDTSGVVEGLLVLAEEETTFKEVVTASKEDSLADESTYSDAVAEVPDESAANVFVDISGLVREAEAEGEVDPDTKLFLENAGIDLKEATAVASLVPGSDQIEIEISSNAIEENVPTGDASELLGSLPADSFAAFAAPEFGKRFNEGIDQIDEEGIPGELPPNQLKDSLKQAGIDLEAIAGSIGDVGAFAQGTSESNLGGALVLTTEDATQAKNTVSNIGLFLRSANVPGVTAINGKASGFSIRDPELGPEPVVVAAKGSRIAVGYGLAATLTAFEEPGKTLADSPSYQDAVSALGETPITAFVSGPAALKLATSIVPPGEEEFEAAEPYLQKIDYVAIGSKASGDLSIAKLIVGLK